MDRPVRLVVLFVRVSFLCAVSTQAAVEPASPPRERLVSPRIARLLAVAAPKYDPPATSPDEAPPGGAAARARLSVAELDAPANTIVRLPIYIVREPKVPKREEVLTRKALEPIAMQKYLGDETGLNRALSMITPVHLWRRIPILGRFPLVPFKTNEQRAMEMYEKEKIAERWEYLLSPEFAPAPKAPAK